MSRVDRSIIEADLIAFADERLEGRRRAEIEAWLDDHPEDREKVEAWKTQNATLREALDPVAAEPVPAALSATLLPRVRRGPTWLGPALAASFTLAIGLGGGWYLGNTGWPDEGQNAGEVVAFAGYKAHKLYTREARHAVEVGADDKDHLVTWLSKRLDAPFDAPDLSNDGLSLLGGRLVSVEGDPGAQLMYETAEGDRYTLFALRADGAASTEMHFEDWDDIGCFYWIQDDVGYALNGPNNRERLESIATDIQEQMT